LPSRDTWLAVAGAAYTALSLVSVPAMNYSARATDELKRQLDLALANFGITAANKVDPSYVYVANVAKFINDYLGIKGLNFVKTDKYQKKSGTISTTNQPTPFVSTPLTSTQPR
jgi:hypothetical protein